MLCNELPTHSGVPSLCPYATVIGSSTLPMCDLWMYDPSHFCMWSHHCVALQKSCVCFCLMLIFIYNPERCKATFDCRGHILLPSNQFTCWSCTAAKEIMKLLPIWLGMRTPQQIYDVAHKNNGETCFYALCKKRRQAFRDKSGDVRHPSGAGNFTSRVQQLQGLTAARWLWSFMSFILCIVQI